MYLCTGFSLNSYAEDTSGYIVGTYNISDRVERQSRDEKKTHRHKEGGWLASRVEVVGACHNSFLVFVSDRFRSGIAENRSQIRYVAILVP